MDNLLHIEYSRTGSITLDMDMFFPCSMKNFNAVIKMINSDWQNEKDLKEELKVYFQNRIYELNCQKKENSKDYFKYRQLAAERRDMINSKKYPNGLPLSKKEFKNVSADFKIFERNFKKALSDFKKCENRIKKFEKYLEKLN